MSALKVQGTIVGITNKHIAPKRGQKQFEPFTVYTLFVIGDDGGKPLEVRTTKNGRDQGDEVELDVYIRPWRTEKSSGYEIRESMPKD